MIEDVIPEVEEIFVGRALELRKLDGLWNLANKDREHKVYVLLNAPGIGKTTLINHFGGFLEVEGKGLFIRLRCSDNLNSPQKIIKEILYVVQNVIKRKETIPIASPDKLIKEYILCLYRFLNVIFR